MQDTFDVAETPRAPITVQDLKLSIVELKRLKELKEEKEAEAELAKADYDAQRDAILAHMQENELPNFKVPGVLNISVANDFYVAQPQSAEDVEAFNAWLAETGRDHMRKVNSQALNSMYKELQEKAAEQGDIVAIPGLPNPSTKQKLQVRKG